MKRQERDLLAANEGDTMGGFLEMFITKQMDIVDKLAQNIVVKKIFKFLTDRFLRKRVLMYFLSVEFAVFARGDITIQKLTQKLSEMEQKIGMRIHRSLIDDCRAIECLGKYITLLGDRKITWQEYAKAKQDFYDLGGRIPLKRRVIWFCKYIWKSKITSKASG